MILADNILHTVCVVTVSVSSGAQYLVVNPDSVIYSVIVHNI